MIKIINHLPPQMHHSRIRLPKFTPVINNEHPWAKPKPGTGLWTSTFDPKKKTSSWLEWCIAEDFHYWQDWRWGFVYDVKSDLKIITIDSQDDLHAALDEFGQRCGHTDEPCYFRDKRFLNFEKIASAGFDAIHLTDAGQYDTRLPMTGSNLYGWDCESTLWLKLHRNTLNFTHKIRLNAIKGKRMTRKTYREKQQIERFEQVMFLGRGSG